jgi:hypothetical protein
MSAADTASGHLARWAWRWRRLQCWSSARRCCSCSICGGSSSCATCCACARAVAAGSTSAWLPVRLPWRRLCELRQLLPPCWTSARRCCSYSVCGCSSSSATCRACARAVAAAGTSAWLPVRRPWRRLCELRRLLLPLVDRVQVLLPQPRPLELLGYMPRVRAVATADTVAWFSSRQAWRWTARAAAAAAAVPTVELERPGYYMPRMRARASGGRCCFCVWCG